MSNSNGITTTIIVALISLLYLRNADATVKSVTQSYHYPKKEVNFNEWAIKEGILVYAVCDKNVTTRVTTCLIVQRKFPYDKIDYSCNVTWQAKGRNDATIPSIDIHAFGEKNAILFWSDGYDELNFGLMPIQLDTCRTKIMQWDDPEGNYYNQQSINQHKIVTYDDDYFDIFFEKSEPFLENQFVIGVPVGLRIGFDRNTQVLYENIKFGTRPILFPYSNPLIFSVASNSPDKGYISLTKDNGTEILWLKKPDGTKKVVVTSDGWPGIIATANNDIISSCLTKNATCMQYDENGELKFKVTLDLGGNPDVKKIYITPGGGFLIAKKVGENHSKEVGKSQMNDYEIIRIDSQGRRVGSIKVKGFDKANGYTEVLDLWQNGDEYCITSACKTNNLDDHVQILAHCFTDNDLSA